MKKILAMLLAFFRLGVDDPAPHDDPAPQDNPQPELDLDPADPDPAPQDDPAPALASAEELQAAREEARRHREDNERYQRELAELRAQRQSPPQNDEMAREEAVLKDPNATELQKWQIQANRELRAGRSVAQTALMQAQDVNDRTTFSAIAISDPVAKKYEARVEKELADMRSKGQNAPREAIYTYLLGKDMREGKFKKKAAPAAQAKPAVDRGRLPGARSDVSGRPGALTNRERLAKKLDGVQI